MWLALRLPSCSFSASVSLFSHSLSYLFLLTLFPPALLLHSRVMGRTLSGKPISFSMFSYFYPIMPCSEGSKATWRFYWGLIKDLWFNPCNLIEISHGCEALALCIGKWRWCIATPASYCKGFALGLVRMYGVHTPPVGQQGYRGWTNDFRKFWLTPGGFFHMHKCFLTDSPSFRTEALRWFHCHQLISLPSSL